ncbi:MAG: hypothetical protein ACFN4G_03070 [Mitsuokella sp.]
MADEKMNWLTLADRFAADGDLKGMRACARELWAKAATALDGAALMAEAALYAGEYDEAATLADEVLKARPRHLRARFVLAGLAAQEFRLDDALPRLAGLAEEAGRERIALDPDDPYAQVLTHLLRQVYGWLADSYYLAAEPEQAAQALLSCSRLQDTPEGEADIYSKYLFMRNYRDQSPAAARREAEAYAAMQKVTPYAHQNVRKLPGKKLKIGYISPDFRQHAVASFVSPLLKGFDGDHFSVYCYALGRQDAVTKRLRTGPVCWRDLRGRSPRTAARLIAEDHIDILVDLSGHSQGSALPILAHRPAPVQVSGIGYTNTTGLSVIDYFLSDETCLPTGDSAAAGFTEEILRLPHSHLCYQPGAVREIPAAGMEAPVLRNHYVTFGSFNNIAKATDETLLLWRGILDQVKGSRLILKGKMCSIPSGRDLLTARLRKLAFDLSRVELRPYSPDYLEQYRDIDIALDTFPYNGGLTTCEALYMGVPVITLRGRTHGSRFGASILKNAGVRELVVENDLNYVRRAVQIGTSPELIGAYHSGLRANLLKSDLMNAKQYMEELETSYRCAWCRFCETR